MQIIYIIRYVAFYKYRNPDDPVEYIYENLFFEDYHTAYDYAKSHNIKEFEIDTLNLYQERSE